LVNKALELFLLAEGPLEFSIYDIPAAGDDGLNGVLTGTTDVQPYIDRVANGAL
jgi:hypothetical protein